MKKFRRRSRENNRSNSLEIHVNSTTNEVIHRPNCPFYQLTDSLSGRTLPSIGPSFVDAPAASPEQSDIVDSIHTPSATIEFDGLARSQSINYDVESSSIPSIVFNRIPIQSPATKSNYLEYEAIRQTCECHPSNDSDDNDDDEIPSKPPSKLSLCCDRYLWSRLRLIRHYISLFVASKYFRRIVLSAIVINTLSMGIEYHGQPDSLTNALEYSNIVFTSLFAIEMIFKIIADGCLKYIKNAYNLFDGGIVIMSVIELQGNQNSGLSVLRTFRLLRVLKLVRFMPTLRRQLVRNSISGKYSNENLLFRL